MASKATKVVETLRLAAKSVRGAARYADEARSKKDQNHGMVTVALAIQYVTGSGDWSTALTVATDKAYERHHYASIRKWEKPEQVAAWLNEAADLLVTNTDARRRKLAKTLNDKKASERRSQAEADAKTHGGCTDYCDCYHRGYEGGAEAGRSDERQRAY